VPNLLCLWDSVRLNGPSIATKKKKTFSLNFCFTVHHQLGKVIQMNQLDATMIHWSIRSSQHVSGNILPIIRSVRLRYLQHMLSCKDGYTESYVVSYVICRNNPPVFIILTIITTYHIRNYIAFSISIFAGYHML